MTIESIPPIQEVFAEQYHGDKHKRVKPSDLCIGGIYRARLIRDYCPFKFKAADYLVRVEDRHPPRKPIHLPNLLARFETIRFSPVSFESSKVVDEQHEPLIDTGGFLRDEVRVPVLPVSLVGAAEGYFVSAISDADFEKSLKTSPAPSPEPAPLASV